MLRARAGWGFAAAGSPPRDVAGDLDAPLDVVGATGSLAGRPRAARGLDDRTLAGKGRFSSPEASSTTSRETTRSTLVSESSTCSTSGSPGGERAQILSARARRELERDLRRVHARINESAQAKEASDKMHAYVAGKKKHAMRVAAKRGAIAAPSARRVDDNPAAIRRAAARALAAGVRRATPESSAELVRARGGEGSEAERGARRVGELGELGESGESGESGDAAGRETRARRHVGQRPPALPSLTFARGGFGGRPPPAPRRAFRANESPSARRRDDATRTNAPSSDHGYENERANDERSRGERFRATRVDDVSLADVTNASFATLARFVEKKETRTLVASRGVGGRPGGSDRSPRGRTNARVGRAPPSLEVRGALARVSRRARRADGALARDDGARTGARELLEAREKQKRTCVASPLGGETPGFLPADLPTLAGGLGGGSFAFAKPATGPEGFVVPSLEDDDDRSDRTSSARGDESRAGFRVDSEDDASDDASDDVADVSADYDFPSPAPSAAAAFIGLSRTSPASAYSACSACSEALGSAPPTPPQFVLKGGFSELEHALYSGATVAFCGGGDFFASDESDADESGADGARADSIASRRFETYEQIVTFGAGGFGTFASPAPSAAGSRSGSEKDSAEDSFDGFEGLRTPGLPDFAPTRVPSLETPPASASAAPSPRSAAIRAETEAGMATRIQAAFRGMRARRRRRSLLSLSRNDAPPSFS